MPFAIDSGKITSADVFIILPKKYGLSCSYVRHLRQINPEAVTNCSNAFLADTALGTLLFKELLFGPTNEDAIFRRYKADIVDFLRENGVKTPHHYRTLTGKGFGEHDEHLIELLEYLPKTRNMQQSNHSEALQLAEELGKMNAVLAELVAQRPEMQQAYQAKSDLYGTTKQDLQALLDNHREIQIKMCKDFPVVPYHFEEKHLEQFFEEVTYQMEHFAFPSDVQYSLIHRDLHGRNILFSQNGQLVAALDFETLSWLPICLDPAYSAIQASLNFENQLREPNYELWKEFIEKWQEQFPSAEFDEKTAIECLRKDGMNRTAYFVKDRYLLENPLPPAIPLNHVAYVKRILDLVERISR